MLEDALNTLIIRNEVLDQYVYTNYEKENPDLLDIQGRLDNFLKGMNLDEKTEMKLSDLITEYGITCKEIGIAVGMSVAVSILADL